MIVRSAICCAAMLALAPPAWSAEKTAPRKVAAKAAPKKITKAPLRKAPANAARKAPAKTVKTAYRKEAAPARVPLGKTETLTCRNGTEDRHARIGVVLIGDRVDSFAYYSKWKPRTCSIYLLRNRDHLSRWVDKGRVTNISTEKGAFTIEHGKGEYRFVFRDVDRERYCGMDGFINGTLTIRKGSEVCQLAGIMEEGTPLGQAYAQLNQAPAEPPVTPVVIAEPPPPSRQLVQRSREPQSTFPSAASGIGD